MVTGCKKNRVVAEFKGGKITLEEFNEELNALPPAIKARYATPQGKKEFLEQLVQQRLILNKAKEEGIDRDPEITRTIETHRRNLIQNKLMQKITSISISPTEEELRQYYDTHISEFSTPTRYCLKRIILKDKNTASKVLKDLKKNPLKFDEAVTKYSEDPVSKNRGGEIGCLQVNQRPDIPQEVFNLKKGSISNIVEYNNFFHIYFMKEILPQNTQKFEEARESIRMRLTNIKRKESYDNFINKLKEESKIKLYPELLEKTGGTEVNAPTSSQK